MTQDPPIASKHRHRPLVLALGAVLAAASVFVLPAAGAILPGGTILWQLLALVIAVGSACWAYRATRSPAGVPVPARRWARFMAVAAILLALVWVGGVGFLWFLWPR